MGGVEAESFAFIQAFANSIKLLAKATMFKLLGQKVTLASFALFL